MLFPPVRPLHPADGAPAVDALLHQRGGVRPTVPSEPGDPVHEASNAAAGARREGRGLQHRER